MVRYIIIFLLTSVGLFICDALADNTKNNTSPQQREVRLPDLMDEVVIRAKLDNISGGPRVVGITNLPDNVTLSISASKKSGLTHFSMENVKTHGGYFATDILLDGNTNLPLEAGTYEVNIVVPITNDGAGMLPVGVDELRGECIHEEYGMRVIEEKFLGTLW